MISFLLVYPFVAQTEFEEYQKVPSLFWTLGHLNRGLIVEAGAMDNMKVRGRCMNIER